MLMLIVLHAGYYNGILRLWGETSARTNKTPSFRGRRPKRPKPKPYPFDAGAIIIREALRETSVPLLPRVKDFQQQTTWLPVRGRRPVPSSSIIAEAPRSKAKLTLAPWFVSALPLTPAQSVEFLSSCLNRRTLAGGVIIGNDLKFWTHAIKFAGALAASENYLPDISSEGKNFRAVWRPIFNGADSTDLTRLAEIMPGSAAAMTVKDAEAPPEIDATQIVRRFVSETLDQIVRMALPVNYQEPIRKKKAKRS